MVFLPIYRQNNKVLTIVGNIYEIDYEVFDGEIMDEVVGDHFDEVLELIYGVWLNYHKNRRSEVVTQFWLINSPLVICYSNAFL